MIYTPNRSSFVSMGVVREYDMRGGKERKREKEEAVRVGRRVLGTIGCICLVSCVELEGGLVSSTRVRRTALRGCTRHATPSSNKSLSWTLEGSRGPAWASSCGVSSHTIPVHIFETDSSEEGQAGARSGMGSMSRSMKAT